ncbi:hypothetical protein EON81_07930 [bacterium]|nr:MAG: hypothetical protein EON81_07930 [bacterium]
MFLKKKIIFGCDSRGDGESPYLTRWKIFGLGSGLSLNLHKFHRSDHDDMHDHPWPFVSLILWRGYIEETPCLICMGHGFTQKFPYPWYRKTCYDCRETGRARKRIWPGFIIVRRAEHIHRVELIDGKPAITLVLTGRYARQWGFWIGGRFEHWKSYFQKRGC